MHWLHGFYFQSLTFCIIYLDWSFITSCSLRGYLFCFSMLSWYRCHQNFLVAPIYPLHSANIALMSWMDNTSYFSTAYKNKMSLMKIMSSSFLIHAINIRSKQQYRRLHLKEKSVHRHFISFNKSYEISVKIDSFYHPEYSKWF